MKNLMKLPAVLLGLLLLLTGTLQKAMAQNEDVSLQSFYDELSPYGTWIQDPEYGYVWRPDVDQAEFRPYYTNGRWAMTEYGNTWVSNYDWGWAPFHYGRWIYNRYNNWIWIPDTVWGPAWVNWRSGGGYYGWAPMGPSIGIHINIGRSYRVPDYCWNFIPQRNIYYSNFPRYYSRRNNVYIQNTVIINNTYVRNNRTYYSGPRAEEIRRVTNQNVTVYNINRGGRPGASRIENNTVNIYNPRPSRGNANNNAAPRNAISADVRTQVVGRDNSVGRPTRGNAVMGQNDRSNGISSRPTRGDNNGVQTDRGDYGMTNRSGRSESTMQGNTRNEGMSNRPNRGSGDINVTLNREVAPSENRNMDLGRTRDNNEQTQRPQRGSNVHQMPGQPQRIERTQQAPPQRTESRAPERQQQTPQRVERSQPQPQRVESRGNEQRSSGGRESRGGGESSSRGGRPGRG